MFTRLPRLAARSSQTILSSTARTPLTARATSQTALRLASTHSAQDDHGHGSGGHGHDDHFDPPGGWLWGQRPGEKYEKEGWEGLAWVFVASWVVAIAAYTMKEDTSYVALPSCFSLLHSLVAWFTFYGGVGLHGSVATTTTEEEAIEKNKRYGRNEPLHLP